MLDQTQWFTWDRLPERWPFPDLKRQKANDKRVPKTAARLRRLAA